MLQLQFFCGTVPTSIPGRRPVEGGLVSTLAGQPSHNVPEFAQCNVQTAATPPPLDIVLRPSMPNEVGITRRQFSPHFFSAPKVFMAQRERVFSGVSKVLKAWYSFCVHRFVDVFISFCCHSGPAIPSSSHHKWSGCSHIQHV